MLTDTLRILAVRWKWVIAAVVIALAAGAVTYEQVPPSYESKAEVLFLPPLNPPGGLGVVNPYTDLDSSLSSVGAIVQATVLDDETQLKLYRQGDSGKYTIAPNEAVAAGPTILITVTDKSAQIAQNTLTAVIVQVLTSLNTLQANASAPPAQYVTAVTLTATTHASTVHKTQIQLALVAAGGLLFILIVTILLVERSIRRRRAARAARALEEDATVGAAGGRDELADAVTVIETDEPIGDLAAAPVPEPAAGRAKSISNDAAPSSRDGVTSVHEDDVDATTDEEPEVEAHDAVAGPTATDDASDDTTDRADEGNSDAADGQDQDLKPQQHSAQGHDAIRALLNRPGREVRRIGASGTPPASPKL